MKKYILPLTRALFRRKRKAAPFIPIKLLLSPIALAFDLVICFPIFLLMALFTLFAALRDKLAYRRYVRRLALDNISSGREFELYVANLLRQNGFENVENTRASGDYGADVIAEKDGVSYAIQCKFYAKPVGPNAVQEAYAAKEYYGCDEAVVVTNSTFTRNAAALAESTGTRLWGRDELYELASE